MKKQPLITLGLAAIVTFSTAPAYAMTLKQTIEDAIVHNPEFRAEVKKYRQYEAALQGAKGSYYPVIDLNAGIGYEEVDNTTINNTNKGLTRQETSIKLTENLFNGFATKNEVSRQKARLDAQAYKAESKANDIALAMTTAYIGLIQQQELLQQAKDNLKTHQKILGQIKQRNDAGIGNQVEVDQANARLSLAQSNYASAQNNYFDALAKFRRVLGRDPDSALTKPKFTYKLPATLKQATNTALIDHPTIRSANGDVAEAKFQLASASKNYYPSIDLVIEKKYDNNLAGIKGKNEDLQAMIRLKYNLYNGGKDSANRDRTASAYHEATEIRNNTRRQVIEDLQYAWNKKKYTEQQLSYINRHIKLTSDTLTGYRKQFSLGRRSLLDLLNTENEYNSALRTLITSDADALTARYRILSSTGHLLPALNISYQFIDTVDHPNE